MNRLQQQKKVPDPRQYLYTSLAIIDTCMAGPALNGQVGKQIMTSVTCIIVFLGHNMRGCRREEKYDHFDSRTKDIDLAANAELGFGLGLG